MQRIITLFSAISLSLLLGIASQKAQAPSAVPVDLEIPHVPTPVKADDETETRAGSVSRTAGTGFSFVMAHDKYRCLTRDTIDRPAKELIGNQIPNNGNFSSAKTVHYFFGIHPVNTTKIPVKEKWYKSERFDGHWPPSSLKLALSETKRKMFSFDL